MPTPVSGTQVHLAAHGYTADIASVGATVRSLSFEGRPLIRSFDADELRPSYRGALLVPWANRVVDGQYTFAGVAQQLALTEPARHHAMHGLVSWLDFTVVQATDARVDLVGAVQPQQGYPHRLVVEVRYALAGDGLHADVVVRNDGATPAPVGIGTHPYLVAPGERVDEWTLELPAATVLEVTPDRLIPLGTTAVATSSLGVDFRTPRAIGATFIDHAFTDLAADADGVAEVRVTDATGVGAAMRFGIADCPWVQVHTADKPDAAASRRSLAVEPMTSPPDAFNSGTDLKVVDAGGAISASWTIAAIG